MPSHLRETWQADSLNIYHLPVLGANTTAVQMAAPVRKILDPPTYVGLQSLEQEVKSNHRENHVGKVQLGDQRTDGFIISL